MEAKNRIVAPRGAAASTDDIVLDEPRVDLDKAKSVGVIEPVVELDKPLAQLAERERFMEDPIEVYFAEAVNEDIETPVVEVTVNGRYFYAKRGDTKMIPRYALEVLARSKFMRVKTERKVDHEGAETMVPKLNYSPCYPFQVISDPRGKQGVEWLRGIMNQPG
jgi:hypothetical protein